MHRDRARHMSNPATTKHLTWKLESKTCHVALYAWFYVYPFWYNTEMWQTHTDTRTDTRRRHIPHLAWFHFTTVDYTNHIYLTDVSCGRHKMHETSPGCIPINHFSSFQEPCMSSSIYRTCQKKTWLNRSHILRQDLMWLQAEVAALRRRRDRLSPVVPAAATYYSREIMLNAGRITRPITSVGAKPLHLSANFYWPSTNN